MKNTFCTLVALFLAATATAQFHIKSEYIPSSSFTEDDKKAGSGDMLKISGRFTMPLHIKKDTLGRPTVWTATLHSGYGMMENKGIADEINPNHILNAGVSFGYIAPMSAKWYFIGSLGAGVYSEPGDISYKSILVSGGAIFMYKAKPSLDLGIGLGLTNSFGIPLAIPMTIVKWKLSGRYELNADLASGMELSVAARFGDKFKLKLVAMEMDGMSAVVDVDGQSMIYASTIMRSYLRPELKVGKMSTLCLGAGGTWLRSVSLTKRTFKAFADRLFHSTVDHDFKEAAYLTIGFKYGF